MAGRMSRQGIEIVRWSQRARPDRVWTERKCCACAAVIGLMRGHTDEVAAKDLPRDCACGSNEASEWLRGWAGQVRIGLGEPMRR